MEKNRLLLGQLSPEVKIALALDMSDGCMRLCAEGIKFQSPDISETELLKELSIRAKWSKHLFRKKV
jgi:hypothetical protein